MSSTRYFERITVDGSYVGLRRMVIDDDAQTLTETTWTGTEWVECDSILPSLYDGDVLLDEISEPDARALRPAAFA